MDDFITEVIESADSYVTHTFDIERNDLGKSAPAIAYDIAKMDFIHTVNMSGNELGNYVPAVARKLANSNSIRTVDMRGNNFSDGDVIEIAKIFALRDNPITLGIETEYQTLILEALNNPIHNDIEEGFDTCGAMYIPKVLVDLIGSYAEQFIEFMPDDLS